MNTQEYRKVYVDVYAVMLRNGTVKPRRFQWEDGAIYQIDRILHITPGCLNESWWQRHQIYRDDRRTREIYFP